MRATVPRAVQTQSFQVWESALQRDSLRQLRVRGRSSWLQAEVVRPLLSIKCQQHGAKESLAQRWRLLLWCWGDLWRCEHLILVSVSKDYSHKRSNDWRNIWLGRILWAAEFGRPNQSGWHKSQAGKGHTKVAKFNEDNLCNTSKGSTNNLDAESAVKSRSRSLRVKWIWKVAVHQERSDRRNNRGQGHQELRPPRRQCDLLKFACWSRGESLPLHDGRALEQFQRCNYMLADYACLFIWQSNGSFRLVDDDWCIHWLD